MKNSFLNFCNALMRRRCFLVGFVAWCFILQPITGRAQSVDDDVMQFDHETMLAVSNLAVRMVTDGSKASTATVEDNVQAILNVLLGWRIGINNKWVSTIPFVGGDATSSTVGSLLRMALAEDWSGNSVSGYDPTSSFFFEIQRALYGQQGVPTSHDSIVQTLLRIESLFPSNQLTEISDTLSNFLNSSQSIETYVSTINNALAPMGTDLASIALFLSALTQTNGQLRVRDDQLADVLRILRNEEDAIDVDLRESSLAFSKLVDIYNALLSLQSAEGSSSSALGDVTNILSAGVEVSNFNDLSSVLSDFGDELNLSTWDVDVGNFDDEGNDWLTAFESSSVVRSNLLSAAFVADDLRRSSAAGMSFTSSVPDQIAQQDDDDRVVESNSFFSWFTSKVEEPPEMEYYQTAEEPSASHDATMQSNLLPRSVLAPELVHSTRIKLAGQGVVAGIRHGDIELDIFGVLGGELGSWVESLDTIVRAGYYGLLAVGSALLFWKYQTKISFVLRDAPRV